MMVALLEPAQIESVVVGVGYVEPEAVDIEGAGAAEVAHPQFRMARPDDVEGRIENGAVNGHFIGFQIAGVKGGDVGHSAAAFESAGRRR